MGLNIIMKILCVIDSLGSGGAQRQLVNLAISFKDRGHDVTFLVYHSHDFYQKLLYEKNINVIQISEPSLIKRIYRMRKAIRLNAPDAVLSFLEAPNLICELASFPKKKWQLVIGERSANPGIKKSIKLRTYRFFHLMADAVVANSHENLRIIKEINPLLKSSKCHVVYNIVDFEQWKPLDDSCCSNLKDKFKIIVAARHNYLKNLDGLVSAVTLLDPKLRERLIIEWYGRTDNDESYNEAVSKIKNNNLENVFNFFPPTLGINLKVATANAVGLFSFYEGLPNTVCEAMASQKLVIASNISDIHILLDEEFIFDPKDPVEISNTIKHIMMMSDHDILEKSKLNRHKALELFDKDKITDQYLKLLIK